ncbi:hypothetical protein EYF80_016245 [Liparis tanakae]|uniref:Uncharacterized protein n=1 Tax=Liparis tanakae TaxID=230148 RepID=A0A4Z2I7L8_9TELE|nr:hypothetical protein EYF80_016245 [Liparis tanakae]
MESGAKHLPLRGASVPAEPGGDASPCYFVQTAQVLKLHSSALRNVCVPRRLRPSGCHGIDTDPGVFHDAAAAAAPTICFAALHYRQEELGGARKVTVSPSHRQLGRILIPEVDRKSSRLALPGRGRPNTGQLLRSDPSCQSSRRPLREQVDGADEAVLFTATAPVRSSERSHGGSKKLGVRQAWQTHFIQR